MIPKVIHYCWFGRNPLPPLAIRCIKSWKEYFPDYEIKEWNESNFDVNTIQYTKEAYQAQQYAFVSDYARFWILYHYGGLYFDTDVEVIKSMDDIVTRGAFMGCENEVQRNKSYTLAVAPGLGIGCNPGSELYGELLELYTTLHFIKANNFYNTKTVVEYTTEILQKHGLLNVNRLQEIEGIFVYPKDYFCPIDYKNGRCMITDNTHSIHHYAASWKSEREKLMISIAKVVGPRVMHLLGNIRRFIIGKNRN